MSNSGVRDYIPNRAFGNGLSGDPDVSLVSLADAADATFTPVPNAVHAMVPTAARSLTLTQADASKTTLRVGCGFRFWIKNDSAGAYSITLVAGGGANVATQGTSTLVVAQGETGEFLLYRTSASVHSLVTLGVSEH